MSKHAATQAILDAFGIDGGNITAVDISIRPGKHPEVTVTRLLRVAIKPLTQRYVLVDSEKAPKTWPE